MAQYKQLPTELTSLVRFAIDELGNAIKITFGNDTYKRVEALRQEMAKSRFQSDEELFPVLERNLKKLKSLSSQKHFEIAHSFSLYMEIINRCESAFRHMKLEQKPIDYQNLQKPYSIIFVFTAHPTEARSQTALNLFKQVEFVLMQKLSSSNDKSLSNNLKHLLMLLIRLPLSVQNKPTVKDEAKNLFSVIFDPNIIQGQIQLKRQGVNIQFRTWVGGDKDGHPYVNESTMLDSWQLSRQDLLNYIEKQLRDSNSLVQNIKTIPNCEQLITICKTLQESFKEIRKVTADDGQKVIKLRKMLEKHAQKYQQVLKVPCPHLQNITDLFWTYPSLVIPLEIREDAELVLEAVTDKKLTISKMLGQLRRISGGKLAKWYVRGFVISMTHSSQDIQAGYKLIKNSLGSYAIPVVPLFETRKALENGTDILTATFNSNPNLTKQHINSWGGRFEVMLGYSDSSKENGVLSSRVLISNSMNKIDRFLKKSKLTPVFFHGSGGSIERGGGSIKEQTIWWPESALNIYKSTIQGEMVSRNFGDPLIMNSMIAKIVENYNNNKIPGTKKTPPNTAISKFAKSVSDQYQSFLKRNDFIEIITNSTPYPYLDQLKIGSRPTKRQSHGTEFKLRAIPWVLCWTQTRILFPTWWGIGSVWDELQPSEKVALAKEAKTNELFTSFLKSLGFTLAKVELEIFHLYLKEGLAPKHAEAIYELFKSEYQRTLTFFQEITTDKELLWFRPWLKESIELRSPMIHPLNLLQLIALKNKDNDLLRETVTGLACGMMTTG